MMPKVNIVKPQPKTSINNNQNGARQQRAYDDFDAERESYTLDRGPAQRSVISSGQGKLKRMQIKSKELNY